jgi:hypothetical protein
MNPTLSVIDAFECAGAALEQAERYHQQKEAAAARAHSQISKAVDACLRAGLLQAGDTTKLASTLADHESTLEWLTKVAEYVAQPPARLGEPVAASSQPAGRNGQAKQAAASPFAGRRSSRLRDSDRRLFENLGLPVPSDD